MAFFSYEGVTVAAVSAAVPKNIFNNLHDNPYFTSEDAEAIVLKTGIKQRRVVERGLCASDLCFAATDKLLNDLEIKRNEIDVMIFISQTPDYRMPATSIILQDRLNLSKSCAAFDINLGCSGYVYGLNMAFSLIKSSSIKNVLVLNGETRTLAYSQRDRKTGFLFGDAGSACLVCKSDEKVKSNFILESDGSKNNYIMIKSGGYRHPSTPESFIEYQRSDGSFRSDEQGFMDGNRVFEFVITEVPKQIRKVVELSSNEFSSIDYFIFHQANSFMIKHLAKKLRIPQEKLPLSLSKYRNTSSVSIPLTLVSELKDVLDVKPHKLLISGFGVGLSWASAVLDVNKIHVNDLIEL